MTLDQLKGFLSFMVKNNMGGVQDSLKSLGYQPASNSADLVNQLMQIYSEKGTTGLNQVFGKVQIDTKNATNDELLAIREITSGQKSDPNAKFTWKDFQDLFAGSTVTTGETSTSTSKPALSPTAVIVVSIIALIAIVTVWKLS